MVRTWPGAAAFAVLCALLIGLGCSRPGQSPDEPDDGAPIPPIEVPPEDLKALVEGNNAFAIDLYKQVAAKTDGNIILSPYSISSALAMTYAGARGQTAEEMKKVLHFTLPDDKLHAAFAALAHQLHGAKERSYRLNIANSLWGQQGFPIRGEFLSLTKRFYRGGYNELDFSGDPDLARNVINRWVAEKTENMIPSLLGEDDVHKATQLILVNAIYFQGNWTKQFPKQNTIDDKFRTEAGKAVPIRMMRETCLAGYLAGDGVQVLVLPYRDNKQSMLVVLPAEGSTLAGIEQKLTVQQLATWIAESAKQRQRVDVALPRFQTGWRSNVAGTLARMGMRTPFGPHADFSGIVDDGKLGIDYVIHEAVIQVSEEGTEAAAATAVGTRRPINQPVRPPVFRADHSFLFAIVDHSDYHLLFLGRFSGPIRMK